MAKKIDIEKEVIKEDNVITEIKPKKIDFNTFLQHKKITGFLKSAYFRKYSEYTNKYLSMQDWESLIKGN